MQSEYFCQELLERFLGSLLGVFIAQYKGSGDKPDFEMVRYHLEQTISHYLKIADERIDEECDNIGDSAIDSYEKESIFIVHKDSIYGPFSAEAYATQWASAAWKLDAVTRKIQRPAYHLSRDGKVILHNEG